MRLLKAITFSSIFTICLQYGYAQAEEANLSKYETIKTTGYIVDHPRKHESANGKYVSYRFQFAPSAERKFGDEYFMVTYDVVKWSEPVGKWSYKKGDQITLEGKYYKFYDRETGKFGKADTGLMGSLMVNDFSYEEVFKEKRKPTSFQIQKVQSPN